MPQRALRDTRTVYDHEDDGGIAVAPASDRGPTAATIHEDVRGRPREIADWGGDELFGGRVPRRRFARAGAVHAAPAHASGARQSGERASGRFARAEERRGAEHPTDPAPTPAAGSPRAGAGAAAAVRPGSPGEGSDAPAGELLRSLAESPPAPARERRTVRIGATEDALLPAPSVRRRPPRTVHERVGPRPDRAAMWAFALGLVLVIVAILTATGLG
jgi:hypothetical protein